MLSLHVYSTCMAPLQAADGHDQCPACLGIEHQPLLRAKWHHGNTHHVVLHGHPAKVRTVGALAAKVDSLSSEFPRIKQLLLNFQPDDSGSVPSGDSTTGGSPCWEDDVLSTAASCSFFTDKEEEGKDVDGELAFRASDAFSQGSDGASLKESEGGWGTMKPAIRMALACLGLDEAPVEAGPSSSFFRQVLQPAVASVPPSKPFIRELQRCWSNP